MGMTKRPEVLTLPDGGKYWEHTYDNFHLKSYIPTSPVNGYINNYTFRSPLLLVFEEHKQSMESAVSFANESGLSEIAAATNSSVLFIYPTCNGGWEKADESLYASVIAEVKMDPRYQDGIVKMEDFFTRQFQGYFIQGAKFRADIYSFGASADYVATHLLKPLQGDYLWGPGDITPAMCSMENLSVTPNLQRNDIAILSVGNSDAVNEALGDCEYLLIKQEAEYKKDFYSFVRKYKRWCGIIELEPDFDEMHMTEEAGCISVPVSKDNRNDFGGASHHDVGYFAYYNHNLFDDGPAPLVLGFHGGGDSSMYLTFVAEWYKIAHKYGFLFVSLENHQFVTATEVIDLLAELKKRYSIDEKRIYATGFSMGSCKTWELFQEYPSHFAAFAPASALFPVKDNPLAQSHGDYFNTEVSVPIFYSGGEASHLTELPFQGIDGLDRVKYAAQVNKCNTSFDLSFEDKEHWPDPIFGIAGDRVEKIYDPTRDSTLTIHYYDSADGVCRTAFASVSGQVHECRHHTCENAWKFISQFTK